MKKQLVSLPIRPGNWGCLIENCMKNSPEIYSHEIFFCHCLTDHSRPPSELSEQLLSEIRHWQPASVTQQDDITLIILDIVYSHR